MRVTHRFILLVQERRYAPWHSFILLRTRKSGRKSYCFFTVTLTFFASTFTPFLSKMIVVGFTGGSFTIITGVEGTMMTSFLTSAGLPVHDMIVKTAASDKKPMIFFIKKICLNNAAFCYSAFWRHTALYIVKYRTLKPETLIIAAFRHIGVK
jgi:hypothetical protein